MAKIETIDPLDNVGDSLRRLSDELASRPGPDPLSDAMLHKGALTWAWHAVSILFQLRLEKERDNLDPWLQEYVPETDREADEGAGPDAGAHIGLLQILDLLSAPDLPSLTPEFYQGWQDRTSRCQGLREQLSSIFGTGLSANRRDQLLYLLETHRGFSRSARKIHVDARQLEASLPVLLELIEKLQATVSSEPRQ